MLLHQIKDLPVFYYGEGGDLELHQLGYSCLYDPPWLYGYFVPYTKNGEMHCDIVPENEEHANPQYYIVDPDATSSKDDRVGFLLETKDGWGVHLLEQLKLKRYELYIAQRPLHYEVLPS